MILFLKTCYYAMLFSLLAAGAHEISEYNAFVMRCEHITIVHLQLFICISPVRVVYLLNHTFVSVIFEQAPGKESRNLANCAKESMGEAELYLW